MNEEIKKYNNKIYKKLIGLAYDDHWGITTQKKEYVKLIKELENKKRLNKSDKISLKYTKRDLKNFNPQWISIEDLKKVLRISKPLIIKWNPKMPKRKGNWL